MVKVFDVSGGPPGATVRAIDNSRQARVKALARCAASLRALFLACWLLSTVTAPPKVKGPGQPGPIAMDGAIIAFGRA